MRKTASFILAVLIALTSPAVKASEKEGQTTKVKGNTTYVSKQYNLKDFDKLSINGMLDVEYIQKQGKPEVTLFTSSNLLDLIIVEVNNGRLETSIKKGYSITKAKYLTLRISSPTLNEIDVKGMASIDVIGKLQQDDLSVTVSGAADVEAEEIILNKNMAINVKGAADFNLANLSLGTLTMDVSGAGEIDIDNLKALEVNANVSGAGEMELSGTTQKARFTMSGAGEIDAEDLVASEVEASASGMGTVTCHAKDKIKAHRSGMGSVKYKGNPSDKDISRGVKAID